MRPVVSDIFVNASTVRVDWLRLSPYASAGTFTSRVLGDGTQRTWRDLAGRRLDSGRELRSAERPDGRHGDAGRHMDGLAAAARHGRERRCHVGIRAVRGGPGDEPTTAQRRSCRASRSSYQFTGPTALFSDDFESGNLAAWTTVNGLTVTAEAAFAGAFGARRERRPPDPTCGRARRSHRRPTTSPRPAVQGRQSHDAMQVLRLRSVGNVPLVRVSINNSGRLVYRNEVAGVNRVSTTTPTTESGTSCRSARSPTGRPAT